MDALNLNSLSPVKALTDLGQTIAGEAASESTTFSDILKSALQEVDAVQSNAEQEVRNLMTGESTDMHSAILAVQKADVSFQMMMAVRGKLIDAYRTVMQMQM